MLNNCVFNFMSKLCLIVHKVRWSHFWVNKRPYTSNHSIIASENENMWQNHCIERVVKIWRCLNYPIIFFKLLSYLWMCAYNLNDGTIVWEHSLWSPNLVQMYAFAPCCMSSCILSWNEPCISECQILSVIIDFMLYAVL